jgi:hypothetical protein
MYKPLAINLLFMVVLCSVKYVPNVKFLMLVISKMECKNDIYFYIILYQKQNHRSGH